LEGLELIEDVFNRIYTGWTVRLRVLWNGVEQKKETRHTMVIRNNVMKKH
jgi:hypothetical protein